MNPPIQPGLIVLHGNRLELLRDVVFDWLRRHPLAPLEEEVFLVQSNAAAEWLKMSLAVETGICAATRFELPGRFVWRVYRRMLGRGAALHAALDRAALTWRLMRLLPLHLERGDFAPVARFLADGSVERRWQLARRLADLFDQYQVYRADWLDAWARGKPVLIAGNGNTSPLPDDQRWQAALWQALLAELDDDERGSTRPDVHRMYMAAMAAHSVPAEPLPRRVVLFGASHVSVQGLEALAALAPHTQVLCAIPNPSRYHWADIIDGREALQFARQRLPGREARALATVPLEAMHLHAHPLLAMWGRQGRDFMRLLDVFDDPEATRRRFDLERIDLFDEREGDTLLAQVQSAIRDLLPLAEHPPRTVDAADRSIVFQVAHGPVREVEILHDALLERLAAADGSLEPRDIIVMVPDIEAFAPAIRAVFGQHARDDARRIPFAIADLRSRGSDPLVAGLEWLLRLPDSRVRLQEIRDLLDVSAVARRAGIDPAALPRLFDWLAGAGVRWGLDADHRARIGLGAAGEQNTWRFGLRRMLLGYATGDGAAFERIEPYDEVGGLEAGVVGALIALIDRLSEWSSLALADATPDTWALHARSLLADLFEATDERERLTLAALQNALAAWLESCQDARFDEAVPLSVMREAWLDGLDGVGGLEVTRRFLGGGVTFCTLMPLRAVPFEVVCLLGMNDGDFPRSRPRDDFDLLATPRQQRPGDRSRRDDDRYLMLEALLSARRMLYVSWYGRSARDNAVQPPSVLVAQLRDYLAAAWHGGEDKDLLKQLTTEHPLQPFSRRYFEAGGPTTYAREWRAAHAVVEQRCPAAAVPPATDVQEPLTIARLERFLRNPAKTFFATRLGVGASDEPETLDDDEAFDLSKLDAYALRRTLLEDADAALVDGVDTVIERRLRRIAGSGSLPLFERGARLADEAAAEARALLARWVSYRRAYPRAAPRRLLRVDDDELSIDDWLDGLASDGAAEVWLAHTPSRLLDGKQPRPDKLIGAWLRMLVACAAGHRVDGFLIGCDATLAVAPLDEEEAGVALRDLLRAWRLGLRTPLPFAIRTALASLDKTATAKAAYEGSPRSDAPAEGAQFALQRFFPDYHALTADGRFATLAAELAAPLLRWVRSSVTIAPPLP
jgi:exodeoxyribonuclease V gamma subunit